MVKSIKINIKHLTYIIYAYSIVKNQKIKCSKFNLEYNYKNYRFNKIVYYEYYV